MDGEQQAPTLTPGKYDDAVLGFRNHWYPAMLSTEIAEEQIVARTLLGEVILFKRVDGVVYAVADRCLHRGFKFSTKPECFTKNTITCWLHAFTYNLRNGDLVAIPSAPDSRLIGKRALHAYPIREVNGLLFTFVGDMNPPPPLDDDVPPGFLDPDWYTVPAVDVLSDCNWRLAADSGFDPNHIFIHKDDAFLAALDRPFPIANRIRHGDSFHEIEERTGDGPKGLIDALGKALALQSNSDDAHRLLGDILAYRDSDHLTNTFIEWLAPTLEALVAVRLEKHAAVEGIIVNTEKGTGGFGYDPLFVPEGFTQSFAELGEDVKNRISHRARALAKLRARLG